MALSTKLHSSFWSDEDVGKLDAAEKLAVVWVLTNRDMNNIGFVKVSRRQFEFDTGLQSKALEGALKGLARGFVIEEQNGGLGVLSLNYVRYQFGDVAFNTKNLLFKNLLRLAAELSEGMREALLSRYEGLARGFQNSFSGISPLQAPSYPLEGSRAEQSRAEQSRDLKGGHGGATSVAATAPGGAGQWETATESAESLYHVEHPAAAGSGLRFDLAEELLKFLNGKTGANFPCSPGSLHQVALVLQGVGQDLAGAKRMVERQVSLWGKDEKMKTFLRPSTLFGEKFGEYFGQRDLPVNRNGWERAEELRDLIQKSRANRESVYHRPDATTEEKEQLKVWRKELGQLEAGR